MQEAAELSRSGGQGELGRGRERLYKTYGKIGYNIRTCLTVINISEEDTIILFK